MAPDVLCKLCELDAPTPSDVHALIPGASSDDIASFFDLLSGTPGQSVSAKRMRMSRSRNLGDSKSTLLEELKQEVVEKDNGR